MKIKVAVLGVLICISCILASILSQVIFPHYLNGLFIKHANFAEAGLDSNDSIEIATLISNYLLGRQNRFEVEGREDINSKFSKREVLHMQDVRNIFLRIKYSFYLSSFLSVIFFFIVKGKIWVNKKYYFLGLIIPILIISFISIFAAIDFDKAFVILHKIIFTNDFWILKPGRDIIISFMPIELFFDMAKNMLLFFIILIIIFLIPLLRKCNN